MYMYIYVNIHTHSYAYIQIYIYTIYNALDIISCIHTKVIFIRYIYMYNFLDIIFDNMVLEFYSHSQFCIFPLTE